MKSPYNFIVSPKGERYNNEVKVDDKSLIINSEIFNHQYVNRNAIVKSCPIHNNLNLQDGDEVLVHHNLFRRWHNVKGIEKNSRAYFKDNLYFASEDQIFLKKSKASWKSMPGFCFVQPLVNDNDLENKLEHDTKGVIVYTDGTFSKGEVIGFTPFSKYEFIVEGKRLFRVHNKFITIKYEHKGNEKTYNPSWA
jgi:hypothetical protein